MTSKLKQIQEYIIKYTETIASVLNVDIEIIDNRLYRISGTGVYKHKINSNIITESYIYNEVFENNEEKIVLDAADSSTCMDCENYEKCKSKTIIAFPIRYKSVIRPGQVLPNGQIADEGTALVETLEAVKEEYEHNKFVGIACAMKNAAIKLKLELEQGKTIADLEGQEFYGEYESITDKMGSDKENPVSHVAYGYATQVVILNEEGKLEKFIAAHDVGKAINPINVEGQIEGGVVMSLGYALTENYPLENCVPTAKYGTLGLFKATDIPKIEAIIVEKNEADLAYGAKGIGEITAVPVAPAVQNAYYNFDGEFRTSLPLENTPYSKKK